MPIRFKNAFFCLLVTLLPAAAAWAQKTVTVSGKINNPISDSVLLEIYTVPASYSGESHTVPVSDNGDFSITAPLEESMVAELVHGSESVMLFLQPGDDLTVRLNADDFISSIKFKGKGTNENNYLVQFERKFQEEEDYQVLPENVHKREKEFLQFLEERRQDQRSFLEKFTKSAPVSDAFRQYAQAQIEYSYANDRLTYVDVRKRVGDLPPQLSASYYNYLNEVNLNQPGATRNQAYLEFLVNYFQFKALAARQGTSERDFYPTMYAMAKKELNGPTRDMMMARILSQSMRFGYMPDTEAMYLDFQKEATHPQFLSYLNSQFKQFKKIGMGSKAPAFTLLSASGDSVSLSSLLQQGKMVYLGFWKNPCGLCTVDQQAYKYFVEQLAAKDIMFVQVSVGEELNAWKQKVTQRPLPAVQLHVQDQSAAVLQDYDVKTFPAYFLIAKDGTLISTNARRPGLAEGAKEVSTLIDQYLASQAK